jgi:hypothetical protein
MGDFSPMILMTLRSWAFPSANARPGRVHFLRAPLPEPDVCVASVCRLEGRLSGRLAGKDADLVAVLVSQGKISHLKEPI